MSVQFGFDFVDVAPAIAAPVSAPGTWLNPCFSHPQYAALLSASASGVSRIVGAGRVLFERGIKAAALEFELIRERTLSTDSAFRFRQCQISATTEELNAFITQCLAMRAAAFPCIEYKTRSLSHMETTAMFVHGVGTLIVRQWFGAGVGILFSPWRDSFFMDSYRDLSSAIHAPRALWSAAYCADKLANSDNKPASVPTISISGREYINGGMTGRGNYLECDAWAFCALTDWQGETFTYRTQCQAWDDGRTERGDRRGLVVNVRGRACVLESVTRIYDDKAVTALNSYLEDEDEDMPLELAA